MTKFNSPVDVFTVRDFKLHNTFGVLCNCLFFVCLFCGGFFALKGYSGNLVLQELKGGRLTVDSLKINGQN